MHYSKSVNNFHLLLHEFCYILMLKIKVKELNFENTHRLDKDNLSNNYKIQSQMETYSTMNKEQNFCIILIGKKHFHLISSNLRK